MVDAASIEEAIAVEGVAVVPSWLDGALAAALRRRAREHDAAGEFADASVGRGTGRARRQDLRGDRIRWIDAVSPWAEESTFLGAIEGVRLRVNRAFALGAFDLEAHYAIYPPGTGYGRHRDRFRDDDARVLSVVVYLNDGWREADGGALRLHLPSGPRDVLPLGGTLVAFLSAEVEHEVLPSRRERLAIAGWLRRREARA